MERVVGELVRCCASPSNRHRHTHTHTLRHTKQSIDRTCLPEAREGDGGEGGSRVGQQG